MDIQLDINHDIDLTNGEAHLVTGRDAIHQMVKIELQFFEGEWFLDVTEGLPFFTRILVHGVNEADVVALYRRKLESIPGIVAVDELSLDLNRQTRVATISGKARDINGSFDFSTVPLVTPEY